MPNNIKLNLAYNNLNEAKKADLRNSFLEKFEYESRDTFYRKLKGVVVLKKIERDFFCEKLSMAPNELFPEFEKINN